MHTQEKSVIGLGEDKLANSGPGLVWSNTKAPLEAYVRTALLRPRFLEILKIVSLIGLGHVKNEWTILESEQSPEVQRASSYTKRILKNIELGSKL